MKKTLLTAVCALIAILACTGLISGAGAVSDDPADTYVKETAASEDSSINLWFEHSFKKVLTEDKTPSGMNTYSVYMAKNEVENAQFVLYSDEDKTGMQAQVTDFSALDKSGASIPAKLYYEMYVSTEGIDPTAYYGYNPDDPLIRAGETPDPVVPMECIRTFKLVAGKSQAFFIKLRTSENTPSGWYSARLDILDSNGNQVKTATVFAYVWDFALSEKTALQTAFYVENNTSYGGNYKAFYDYMLDNRMCGMDLPGKLDSSNEYLYNDRVTAIRVSTNGCGSAKIPYYIENDYSGYEPLYNELQALENWDSLKQKFYFYNVDEPNPNQMEEVMTTAERIRNLWVDPAFVIPVYQNLPYPYGRYTSDTYSDTSVIGNYPVYERTDLIQAMIDADSSTLWCPMTYAFTPHSLVTAAMPHYGDASYSEENSRGYTLLNGVRCGQYIYTVNGQNENVLKYYDWDALYGEMKDRMASTVALDSNGTHRMWAYCCMRQNSYNYCQQLIENTGLQTKMLFWQLYQEDVTGYLYYATNGWSVFDDRNDNFVDRTPTGGINRCIWKTNKVYSGTGYIYGDGVLFYGRNQGRVSGVDLIGSLRVEIMRDGIEDYQMLSMLSELKGKDAAKAVVAKVSNNVVDYLSMPTFSTAVYSSDMDEYDIMAGVRRGLGSAVEAAVSEGQCEHSWDDGVVTEPAGCITAGEMKYTCAACGASRTEVIPTVHSVGNTFEPVSGSPATCTKDSSQILRCTECGYEKTETVKAFHKDRNHYKCESKNATTHNLVCDTCGSIVDTEAHVFLYSYTNTCTEAGEKIQTCRYCGYSESVAEVEAKGHNLTDVRVEPDCGHDGYVGQKCTRCDYLEKTETLAATGKHNYVNGVCSVCGAKEPTPEVKRGDITGDGRINASDLNMLKRILVSVYIPDETESYAADVNGDGRITVSDANYLKRIFVGVG